MEHKKQTLLRIISSGIAVVLILVFLSISLIAFSSMNETTAWFMPMWDSGLSVLDFSVGTVPAPDAIMWIYSTEFDEGNSEAVGWVEHSLTGNAEDPHAFLIPSTSYEETNGSFIFEMKSLQLGTVDNLVIMNNDNTVYLRFAFDSELHGNSMATLSAELSDDLGALFHIYDSDGHEVTDETLKNQLLALNQDTPFLKYQACISAEALSPEDDEFSSLPFSEDTLFGTQLELYGNGQQPIDGEYYIYIKLMPNLTAFAPASELLNTYMPCVILFDTKIQLTVH